jgi:hypothetical protein
MKKQTILLTGFAIVALFLITACSPVTLTSWKNPKVNEQISKVVVWGMFNKLDYEKPFEDGMISYFNEKGLKAIAALDFLNPNQKYEMPQLEKMVDSVGADAILIFAYKGTDKTQDYVPPTTTVYPDYYYNYYGFYNWYYPFYAPGYDVVTTGGYWVTTTTVNLTANLYANSNNLLIWTASVSITDPQYVDQAGIDIARSIYQDWIQNDLLKFH